MKNLALVLLFAGLQAFPALHAQDAPLWLVRRTAAYPPEQYVSGTGEGRTAEEAREKAVAQISRFFNTKVADTRQLLYSYNEALAGAGTETASLRQNTVINSEAEFFGVEFAGPFTDRTGVVHALAYIDRAKALGVYDGRIQANALLIGDLIKRYEHSGDPKAVVRRLEEAKRLALVTAEYADMAILLDSAVSPRYAELPAVASRIDGMIEANQKRFTASISLNDEAARPLAHKTAELLRRAGFLVSGQEGVYAVFINFEPHPGQTKNYRTVEPTLVVTVESGDGTPLAAYTKKYPLFRHLTCGEALSRALRNIEQDLSGEFFALLKGIGK
jgi:hypothetical protein